MTEAGNIFSKTSKNQVILKLQICLKFSWLSNLKEMWWQEKEDMVVRRGKLVEKVTQAIILGATYSSQKEIEGGSEKP